MGEGSAAFETPENASVLSSRDWGLEGATQILSSNGIGLFCLSLGLREFPEDASGQSREGGDGTKVL